MKSVCLGLISSFDILLSILQGFSKMCGLRIWLENYCLEKKQSMAALTLNSEGSDSATASLKSSCIGSPLCHRLLIGFSRANSCADWLANLGVEQAQGVSIMEVADMPRNLSRLVEQDARGVAFPRYIPSNLL